MSAGMHRLKSRCFSGFFVPVKGGESEPLQGASAIESNIAGPERYSDPGL